MNELTYFRLHFKPVSSNPLTLDIRRSKLKHALHEFRISYSRQAQCPLTVREGRAVRGGVQHPAVWQATDAAEACPQAVALPAQENTALNQFASCPYVVPRNRLMYSSTEAPCSGHVIPCGASPERRRFNPLACTGFVGLILHPWDKPRTILTQ